MRFSDTVPIEPPREIACAGCGNPLNCLTSYGLSTPLDGKVRPADFCGLNCLATWAAQQASAGRA